MSALLSDPLRASRHQEVARLAEQVALPFRSRAWRGAVGAGQGLNHGNSVDFQDHRAYLPGDDPRHLDWAAYARTNHYTMKLFREEVTPRLDVVLDASRSMALTPEKEARTLALLALVLSAALHDGLSLRIYAVHSAGQWRPLETPAALALDALPPFPEAGNMTAPLPLSEVPWRIGSLRVLVSDLLIPHAPESLMGHLSREQGRCIILAPYLQAEADPDWRGNLELHDCETPLVRQQRAEPSTLSRYRRSYQRHFESWQETARRHGVPLARISSDLSLSAAVRQQALPVGAFVLRH